jgi:hypothetical protein
MALGYAVRDGRGAFPMFPRGPEPARLGGSRADRLLRGQARRSRDGTGYNSKASRSRASPSSMSSLIA